MSLTKDSIAALTVSDEIKKDLTTLFDSITAKETEIENLRKKVPTDSQKVVESVDHDKFVAATQELELLKTQMAEKLQKEAGEEGETILSAFAHFFS